MGLLSFCRALYYHLYWILICLIWPYSCITYRIPIFIVVTFTINIKSYDNLCEMFNCRRNTLGLIFFPERRRTYRDPDTLFQGFFHRLIEPGWKRFFVRMYEKLGGRVKYIMKGKEDNLRARYKWGGILSTCIITRMLIACLSFTTVACSWRKIKHVTRCPHKVTWRTIATMITTF